VLFDLDGTLVHAVDKRWGQRIKKPARKANIRMLETVLVYYRRDATALFQFAQRAGYKIGVISAGRAEYVHRIVRHLFRGVRVECILSRDETMDENGNIHKDLDGVSQLTGVPIESIILFDDLETTQLSKRAKDIRNNHIRVPMYTGDDNDCAVRTMWEILGHLRTSTNLAKDIGEMRSARKRHHTEVFRFL